MIGMRHLMIVAALAAMSVTVSFSAGAMNHEQQAGHGMALHHLHMHQNHALIMVLQGSTLVMTGQMEMAKGIDALSIDHGRKMMKEGRALLNESMSGEHMLKMHGAGTTPAGDPGMSYSHQLGEAQLKVMDLLSKMDSLPHTNRAFDMTMHHEHIMLNQALVTALEGSNLVMLGQMGMAKGLDESSERHGKAMMRQTLSIFNEVMSGETMTSTHEAGITPDADPLMAHTHELAEAQLNVLNLLGKMPAMMH